MSGHLRRSAEIRTHRAVHAFRQNQWALPLAGAVVGILLAAALRNVDRSPEANWEITVSQARVTLAGLVALMFTILSLSLSLTTIAMQNMSGRFSLRLLTLRARGFRDKIASSLFALAVSFIAVELFRMTTLESDSPAPRTAFYVSVLLIIVSGVGLFGQLNDTVQSLRLDRTLRVVSRVVGRTADMDERVHRHTGSVDATPDFVEARAIDADVSGYIGDIDIDGLHEVAWRRGVSVLVRRRIGEAVATGDPLGWIDTGGTEPSRETVRDLRDNIEVVPERDPHRDVTFGIRIMVDTAIMALSPAVNDPYTAVQTVDQLTLVLGDLAGRPLGTQVLPSDGTPLVWIESATLDDHLHLATDEIRRYGASEPHVVGALLRLSRTIERVGGTEDDREAARKCRDAVARTAFRQIVDTANREQVERMLNRDELARLVSPGGSDVGPT